MVDGKVVRLERDEKGEGKDVYGRLLRYVYVDDIFVNAELVRKGYASVYPKGLFPEMEHYDLLKEAEEEAKEAGRGMWGSSDYYSSSRIAYMGLKAFTLTLATLPLRSKQA
jgi:micrococcal nuclease